MKAIIRETYCDFSDIQIKEIQKPTPKSDEILVKIRASTINRTDCAVVNGKPFIFRFFVGFPKPRKIILGTDFSGEIVKVGNNISKFKIGDKVFGFHDEGIGSQAEYALFKENQAIEIMPSNVTFEQAVASLEGGHYAINFLNKVDINAKHKVVVNGATGGIGSVLLQILKHYGCYVTAVCNTKNIDLIKSLGADKIYDYEKEDFTKDTERYDYVFDAVGKSTFKKCKPLLKKKGIYISSELGDGIENLYLPLTTKFSNKKVIFPIPTNIHESIRIIKDLLEKEALKPVIDKIISPDEVVETYKYVNSGQKTGSVVIRF
ncbi:MAG: NAD(P)-dependent alcohol dehydrogenase [Saprospiraceae bacterium]